MNSEKDKTGIEEEITATEEETRNSCAEPCIEETVDAAREVPDMPEAEDTAQQILSMEQPPMSPKGLLLKPLHLLFAILGTVVLMIGSVFLGIWINQNILHDPDIDPGAFDYGDLFEDQENTDPENIAAPGYGDVILAADTQNVQMVLINPKGNPCYFQYVFELEESGEEIYRSGLIPPGMAVTELALTRPLEAGEYRLRIRIETQSLQDKSPMNGIEMAVKLTVIKQSK